jgi:hypothetical protein
MRRMRRMLRVVWVVWVFPVFLATRVVRLLGWPLLAAPGQAGWATKRVLLGFHS